MTKKYFYEYFDIINTTNKLQEIEKKAEKNDIYSWRILVDEIKNNIIMNDHIEEFIIKTEKNINFSNIYYNTINNYINETMEKLNEENNNNFIILKKQIILASLNEKEFYKIQKKHICNDAKILKMVIEKILCEKAPNEKLTKYCDEKIIVFEKRINLLKLIYKYNKDSITFEDDILLNFGCSNDLVHIVEAINNNNKTYHHHVLPKNIKIKEINKNPIMEYDINNKIKNVYINIIIEKYKNHRIYNIYENKTFSESCTYTNKNNVIIYRSFSKYHSISFHYLYTNHLDTKLLVSLVIIIFKEFLWLIYKFHKFS